MIIATCHVCGQSMQQVGSVTLSPRLAEVGAIVVTKTITYTGASHHICKPCLERLQP